MSEQHLSRKDRMRLYGHGPWISVDCICGSSFAVPLEMARREGGIVYCSGSIDPDCRRSYAVDLLLSNMKRIGPGADDFFVDMSKVVEGRTGETNPPEEPKVTDEVLSRVIDRYLGEGTGDEDRPS